MASFVLLCIVAIVANLTVHCETDRGVLSQSLINYNIVWIVESWCDGVGQASSESSSCLLPELAVAMPKILRFPIFGHARSPLRISIFGLSNLHM